MSSIIQLGVPGTLRNYSVKARGDGLAWGRGPSKPFAAQVNTSNPYDKVDAWNEWVMENWQAGLGRVDPTAGGQLFSTVDSRVPNQLILPPLLRQCDQRPVTSAIASCRYMPETVAGTITVGTGSYQKVAVPFSITAADVNLGGSLPDEMSVYFYGQFPNNIVVKVSVYTNSGGQPSTSVASNTFFAEDYHKDFSWMGNYIYLLNGSGVQQLSGSTTYYLVIEPNTPGETFTLVYGNSGYASSARTYDGASWTTSTTTYPLYTTNVYSVTNASIFTGGSAPSGATLFRFNGNTYHTYGQTIYKYDSANEEWDSVTATASGNIISAAVFGPKVYFGTDVGSLVTMDTSEALAYPAATNATIVREWKGYLFRSYQNGLAYTADGSTWTSTSTVGGSDAYIRGMAGMGDSLYLATDKALYRLAPGDVIEPLLRFGAESSDNGLNMIQYDGNLYIPAAGRLFQYTPSGQLLDVWIGEDDLPIDRIGRIDSLCVMNQWLIALVSAQEATYNKPMALVYQREGWHALATLPNEINYISSFTNLGVFYDRANSRLWIGTSALGAMYVEIPDYTLNPYTIRGEATYHFQYYGWLETDRFYGGQMLLNKDWESVTLVGDNMASQPVDVYWKDDDSSDWESLGTISLNGQELRWSDYTTRPAKKWVKIGLRLKTTDTTDTPRVRAVVVKFLPMVTDRIRDTITITLSDYIEHVDDTKDSYTMTQQKAHIESLLARVPPTIYQDPFGTQYEVQIVDYSMNIPRYTKKQTTGSVTETEVTLVLEQVPDSTYSP